MKVLFPKLPARKRIEDQLERVNKALGLDVSSEKIVSVKGLDEEEGEIVKKNGEEKC